MLFVEQKQRYNNARFTFPLFWWYDYHHFRKNYNGWKIIKECRHNCHFFQHFSILFLLAHTLSTHPCHTFSWSQTHLNVFLRQHHFLMTPTSPHPPKKNLGKTFFMIFPFLFVNGFLLTFPWKGSQTYLLPWDPSSGSLVRWASKYRFTMIGWLLWIKKKLIKNWQCISTTKFGSKMKI